MISAAENSNKIPKTRFLKEKLVEHVVTLEQTAQATLVYLWSKVVCLFCFVLYLWDSLNWDASDGILGLFGRFLRRRGASTWFHGVWTCGAKVFEYWMISSLKIKLDPSWKFWRNQNVPLVLLERSWWARFNGIYLVRFGFRMWEILILKWFLQLKIQINSKKPGFGKEKSLKDVVTLGPMAQATLVLHVTGCGEIEHPPGSGYWVSASGADLLLKGWSN